MLDYILSFIETRKRRGSILTTLNINAQVELDYNLASEIVSYTDDNDLLVFIEKLLDCCSSGKLEKSLYEVLVSRDVDDQIPTV